MLAKKKVMPKLCALIVVAMLASGAAAAHAEGNNISNKDALEQTVLLYEKLQNSEVSVPAEMKETGLDSSFLKSVVLGFANLDDSGKFNEQTTIRKQDMVNILYKTILNYDDNYAITSDEADAILNSCYDNAYIDEENRIAYAFMIKQGIISGTSGSEPDKELTWDGCRTLVDRFYSCFAKQVTFTINGTPVTTGANISTVTDALGAPNRIDESAYGFDWYVYNSSYKDFIMIGVDADRICAVYSNSPYFSVGDVKVGDEYIKTADYKSDKNFKFFTDASGKVDAILYNPFSKEAKITEEITQAFTNEFIDIVNAYRSKNSKILFAVNENTSQEINDMLAEYKVSGIAPEGYDILSGYDVFALYNQLLNSGDELLSVDTKFPVALGINAYIDENYNVVLGISKDMSGTAELKQAQTVELSEETFEVNEPEEVTTPVIVSPASDVIYNEGDDVVIELAMQAASQYHVEVFDVEDDKYIVNEYIKTDSTTITLPAELFTVGADYRMVISSITPDGVALASEDVLISYGSAYDTGIRILTPENEGKTDDDYLAVSWESDQYSDFVLDLYDEEGNLLTSKVVKDEYEAVIRGIDPGNYYIYITALRRDTNIEKAQSSVAVTVNMPDPVITETILEPDDVYYFVYEDEAMGVLYFYDEELVDVEVEDSRGRTTTEKRKKIIQKQVKATKAYKELAKNRVRIEKATGEPKLDFFGSTEYSSEMGNKIVAEASKYLGVPYVWGGTTPSGFDCSGLVQYVLRDLGIDISRVTQTQCKEGQPIAKGDLQPGDLVFFESNGDVHHVGIYIGNGQMIHAPRTGDVVKIQDMNTEYYSSTYYCARRMY